MKTLFRLIAIAGLFLFGAKSFAQGIETPSLTYSVITNAYTTDETIVIDTRKQENVAVAFVFSQTAATNALPLTFTFKKSVDGVNASDADTISWAYTRSAVSTTQVATTNLSVGGYPYLILKSIAAPGAGANLVTVSSFKYFIKYNSTK